MLIQLPYGPRVLTHAITDGRPVAVVQGSPALAPRTDPMEIIDNALARPFGTEPLYKLAQGHRQVVLLASDHTLPVPSYLLAEAMLHHIRYGNPDAEITILVSTGPHRAPTMDELAYKFGERILAEETLVLHDPDDENILAFRGTLPSGGRLLVNRLALGADLLVSEGVVMPHYLSGYTGGPDNVVPGVAAYETVCAAHCSASVGHPYARPGSLDQNPIYIDMLYAAQSAGLDFICNLALDEHQRILAAFAGDCEQAHRRGAAYVAGIRSAEAAPADIVLASCGGYPLDQNLYQAAMGITAASAACREGGVIILAAACMDGMGGHCFADMFLAERSVARILQSIQELPGDMMYPEQWQIQRFAEALLHHTVILVSDADPDLVRGMHMRPAINLGVALQIADSVLGRRGSLAVVPDGPGVIIQAGQQAIARL